MRRGHEQREMRRRIVRGVAWTVPAIAVATMAPAVAASRCGAVGTCPNLAWGTVATANSGGPTGNQWTATLGGGWGNSNLRGFQPATTTGDHANRGSFLAAASEPVATGQDLIVRQTGQPALNASCTYTISADFGYWADSSPSVEFDVLVGDVRVSTLFSTTGLTGSRYIYAGTRQATVTGRSGAVSFQIRFVGGSGGHDDVYVYNPRIACT